MADQSILISAVLPTSPMPLFLSRFLTFGHRKLGRKLLDKETHAENRRFMIYVTSGGVRRLSSQNQTKPIFYRRPICWICDYLLSVWRLLSDQNRVKKSSLDIGVKMVWFCPSRDVVLQVGNHRFMIYVTVSLQVLCLLGKGSEKSQGIYGLLPYPLGPPSPHMVFSKIKQINPFF